MGNINGQFADQDSYVLPILLQTAATNQADLNVVIQESDYLQATSVAFQTEGLTATAANPVPNVTIVAQQTLGEAIARDGGVGGNLDPIE